MRKNIVVILVGSLVLALSTLGARDAFGAVSSQDGRGFTQALAEARRLSETEAGKAYDAEFGKVVAPRLSDIVSECTKNLGSRVNFKVVFVFAADGHVDKVLTPSDQPAAKCVGDNLRDLHLAAPPRANWPVALGINISPENSPRIVALGLKLMETGVWEVDATISRAFKFRVHGLLAGQDFDLTVEPEDRNAFRLIAIKDKLWSSFDGSKTWKLEDAKGHALAQRFYAFVHNPLRSEAASLTLEVAKQETRDGETWMQLRPKKSGKSKAKLQQTEYWIVISQDPKRNGVRRYDGPVTEPGHEKEPLHCVATYQPANNKTIEPPANAAALPEKESGQSAPPDAKFATDTLKYSRDFYSKVHLVAIANLDFGRDGTAEFKYDRYPNGGPERIQTGDGKFARKDGKTWLKSNDWGETGKPVDAQTSKRLNNWRMIWSEKEQRYVEADENKAPESSPLPAAPAKSNAQKQGAGNMVSLLDGKLKIDIPSDFSRDPEEPKDPKTLAKFTGPDSAWGAVLRGTHGLTPEKLEGYLKMRVAEYSKGFNWLPKDSHLQWLKKDVVAIDGRRWADWRYVPMLKGAKDYRNNPVYTRFLTTCYKGQLLAINFTSNLNTSPQLKEEIDHIMDSVHLEE
jgi:hypothetical protein